MSPGQAVRDVLLADARVTAKVVDRIFPLRIPQTSTKFPAIVFVVVSTNVQETFDTVADAALSDSRVQIDCYAREYDDAQELAEAVDDVLTELDDQDMRVVKLDTRDLYEDDTRLHHVSADFSVWRGR